MLNMLTVDVEDYFHHNEAELWVDRAEWDARARKVYMTDTALARWPISLSAA